MSGFPHLLRFHVTPHHSTHVSRFCPVSLLVFGRLHCCWVFKLSVQKWLQPKSPTNSANKRIERCTPKRNPHGCNKRKFYLSYYRSLATVSVCVRFFKAHLPFARARLQYANAEHSLDTTGNQRAPFLVDLTDWHCSAFQAGQCQAGQITLRHHRQKSYGQRVWNEMKVQFLTF